jgi:hypothetical protein
VDINLSLLLREGAERRCPYIGPVFRQTIRHLRYRRQPQSDERHYEEVQQKIWDRKMAYLDAREAAEKIFSAQLELATKRGTITEDQTMEKELKMFDQTLEGESKFEEEFQSMCLRLTGTE